MRDKQSNELVAVKFIQRGDRVRPREQLISGSLPAWGLLRSAPCLTVYGLSQIDKNVEREILNHRMLNNVNVIGFKEVSTQQHGQFAEHLSATACNHYRFSLCRSLLLQSTSALSWSMQQGESSLTVL